MKTEQNIDTDWVNVYDDLADKYTNPIAKSGYITNGEPLNRLIFEKWFESIQNYFQVNSNSYLLDVGCGAGVFLKLFAKYTPRLFGIDLSSSQLQSAKILCPEAILEKSDALLCPFTNIQFDRLFCNSVFMYFPNLSHAKKVIEHFLDISSTNAKIWIGDISQPTENGMDTKTFRRKTMANNLEVQHYPVSFFDNLAEEFNIKGRKIDQLVEGKPSSAYRYDYLFEKI